MSSVPLHAEDVQRCLEATTQFAGTVEQLTSWEASLMAGRLTAEGVTEVCLKAPLNMPWDARSRSSVPVSSALEPCRKAPS